MTHVVCRFLYATCRTWHIVCRMLHVSSRMPHVGCRMPNVEFTNSQAGCGHVACYMPCITCCRLHITCCCFMFLVAFETIASKAHVKCCMSRITYRVLLASRALHVGHHLRNDRIKVGVPQPLVPIGEDRKPKDDVRVCELRRARRHILPLERHREVCARLIHAACRMSPLVHRMLDAAGCMVNGEARGACCHSLRAVNWRACGICGSSLTHRS